MRIINLLNGILAELQRLNKNLERYPSLGENAALVVEFNAKAARLRNNPLLGMTEIERLRFKDWIAGRFVARKLAPENLAHDVYHRNSIKEFVQDDKRCASIEVRDAIAKGLGYRDFIGLYEDYKTQEGGAA
ncbi:MAG: hypothetical protein LBK62_11980 [Treponema sp.]|jgi:hypothetical protein|nr:hypothetical protein [Treponema sp.]